MSVCTNLIHPATVLDAEYVASTLQDADKQEINGLGYTDHREAVVMSVLTSEAPITFWNPDGMICGVAGVSRTDTHMGAIWMLTTTHIQQCPPRLFLTEARNWVDSQTNFDLLYNIADPRNRLHMKLLHLLGFKRLGYQAVGPKHLTYVEFAKIQPCASQPQL
jgi:hypothetical protein